MLNIPGYSARTCEGPTRRELMRIGSLGLAGLHLPGFFMSQKAALANEVIDTVQLARKRFPGAPASLDALCKRFNIDNSARTFHGALLDAQLLAEVEQDCAGLGLTVRAGETWYIAHIELGVGAAFDYGGVGMHGGTSKLSWQLF